MERSSMGKALVIAIVLSALVGPIASFGAVTLAKGPSQPPTTREIWVFTVVLPFNDSTPGFPSHAYFAPDRITVNKGDTVKIHFFNTEDEPEDHTFTRDPPCESVNVVVHYGETANITFVAGVAGIFPYRCTYHQPTMTGSLVLG